MLNVKTLNKLVLFACIVAIPLVVIVLRAGGSAILHKNEPFCPEIVKSLPQVNKIQLKSQHETLTLVYTDKGWGIVERHNYPVSEDKVQEVLQGLAQLKIVEPKTKNALLYEQLDLADLNAPGAKGVQIILQDEQQHELANVIIGKREAYQAANQYSERIMVRKSGEQQAWLVQGLLPLNMNVRDWLAQPMENMIHGDQIKRLAVTKTDASKFVIVKATPEQEDFALENAPSKAGMKLDSDAVNTVPYEVAELEFIDMLPAQDKQLDWSKALAAEVETFPGLALDLNIIRDADMVYAKVVAKAPAGAAEDVQEQVAQFNASTYAWVYRLAPEFYNTIDLAASDFLQVDEPATVPGNVEVL